MAMFTVVCSGCQWQADFPPLLPDLERLFKRYFRSWHDREEVVHNAVLLFMARFAAAWKQGETIQLTTNYTVRDVRQGHQFYTSRTGGRGAVGSVPTVNNRMDSLTRLRARLDRFLTKLDMRMIAAGLKGQEWQILKLALTGLTINEVASKVKVNWLTVRATLQRVLQPLR